jgi:heterodisulfide reductase subunit C
MTIAASLLGFATLFALFGVFRPKGKCTENCGACTSSCGTGEQDDR